MPGASHTIADHDARDLGHDHGPGVFDHDHDGDVAEDPAAPGLSFLSLGLDIGSSSTQLAISRLNRRGPAGMAERQTLFLSPVVPTPFDADGRIDLARLDRFLGAALAAAGHSPDDIETGAVILTGAAAERENAAAVTARLAAELGDLVCAAAGHHLEARLSAHGSGAVARSAASGACILLVDIGGATTKFALVDRGEVVSTAAMAAGGRLLVIGRDDRVLRLEPAGAALARSCGIGIAPGERLAPGLRAVLAEALAARITAAVAGEAADSPWLTPPLRRRDAAIDGVLFAGGVGEYVYGAEARDFGDLGRLLGRSLRRRIDSGTFPLPLLPAGERIRATVLGAAEHSLQLSGDTIFISAPASLLPRRNMPVIRPKLPLAEDAILPEAVASAIRSHLIAFDLADAPARPLALVLRWQGAPAHGRIRALAQGIADGMRMRSAAGSPFHILVDGDIAMTLGRVLKHEVAPASEVLVLDRIETGDFDYVDIGRIRLPSGTVPVTVKSLLFGGGNGPGGA